MKTPPPVPGLPLIGNAVQFKKNPVRVLQEGYDQFGSVFSIRLGPMKAAVLIGPDHHQFFYNQTDDALSMSAVYQAFVPIFGEGFTLAVEHDEYKEQRAILQPAFQPQKMPDYLNIMVEKTNAWLDKLGPYGAFDLTEAFEQLAVRVTAASLMGDAFLNYMGDDFGILYRDVVRGIEVMLPHNLPLPRFRRRDRARKILHNRIRALITQRRNNPQGHHDFFQELVEARYSNNELVPEGKLESMILFLVFSASESTPLQASWSLIHLLQHPEYLQRVLAEQAQILEGNARTTISVETLSKLQQVEWALKESERLLPMTTMLWRKTVKSYQVNGYDVPEGWITIICPAVAHRMGTVFTNPLRYDPDRFAPPRAEDRQTPFSLAGFGGGRHKCPGVSFAYNFMKVIFSLLLERYNLELQLPDPQPDYSSSIARPPSPCLVHYKQRTRPLWESNPVVDTTAAAAQCPHHKDVMGSHQGQVITVDKA